MSHFDQADYDYGEEQVDIIDVEKIVAIARRQLKVVLVSIGIMVALAIFYLMTAVPRYTAQADVMLDKDANEVAQAVSLLGGSSIDEASLLSQIELFYSEKIGYAVVDKLDLTHDPVFTGVSTSSSGGLGAWIRSLFGAEAVDETDMTDESIIKEQRLWALWRLQSNLVVERVGRTLIFRISYTSPSPQMAAKIADAFADAYLADQLDSKYDATRRASTWLQTRIDELRKKSLESDLAVQKFRTEHNLVTSATGTLISEQQLAEVNSAYIVAQADTAKAKAKLDRINSIIQSGDTNAVTSDSLASQTIQTLRNKFLEASKLEAEISGRLGKDHVQAVRLRGEMDEYHRLMFEELKRIAASLQSEYDVAQGREKDLRRQLSQVAGTSASDNETLVQLRELERESDTYKNLYESFLQKFQEATQEQSFPVTQTRVINRAQLPYSPSHPKKGVTLLIAIFLGGMIGCGVGAYREFRDRFFRTGDQIRSETGLEYLGSAPMVTELMSADQVASNMTIHPRLVHKKKSISSYVIDHPLSAFAETLRSAKIAADLAIGERTPKVIGIVSVLPHEGKTSVATNFAELLASQGSRTLLIDGDLRSPGLTRSIASHAEVGIVEALLEDRPLSSLLLMDPDTKLAVLPAVVKHRLPHTSELVSSMAMSRLLDEAGRAFDHIVIDLPPLGPVVDARAVAPKIDAFILVVEWGKTARKVVRSTLNSEPQIVDKCLGVVLNKVDYDKMKFYRSYGSGEFYYARYQSYYSEAD
ncbi:polysaccharide biosynthesis tyrosine autokinase [Hartmannibacter diazotrophicus]|uniref:polysaccharide biosynthesis tyrosine autokinase n=1 Tax=Hartmannibacter diazotrophicus TaxID=1482074 RepID=UPI001FE8657A|nr:polysaccharide biosynthesis tyrosine autokinase [Hartmannibacter diazotrophicus]